MARLPFLLVASILLSLSAYTQQTWRAGEVLVLLDQEARVADVRNKLSTRLPDGVTIKEIKQLGSTSRYHKLVFEGVGIDESAIARLVASTEGIRSTSLNHLVQWRAQPNDPQYVNQWHLADMNVEPVWNTTTGGTTANGKRIAVGIIDSGVQGAHPDLADNMVVDAPASFDHGTQVAGVVGAVGNNGEGVSGVNWDVDLVSAATVNDLSDAFTQFQFCLDQRTLFNQSNGAQGHLIVALTLSWGIPGADCGFGEPMFDDLGAAGVLVVTAGPNDPTDIDVVNDFPATCPNANNIVVTSYGQLGQVPFAVGDNTVHMLAPGLDIRTTDLGGGYTTEGGNSFAIPAVAGAVALLYSNDCFTFAQGTVSDPQGTALQVKQAILSSVTPFPGGNAITVTGGKLNVNAAYQSLANQCVPCTEVTVALTTPAGSDVQHTLANGLGTLISQGTGASIVFCAADGCYSGQVLDAGSQPLNGTFTATVGGNILASGSILNGVLDFELGSVVHGCTNPDALNHNPLATCDDGSCCTEGVVQIAILTDELGLSGSVDVTVTLGGTVVHDGQLPIGEAPGYGVAAALLNLCESPGCLSVAVGASDVPLAELSLITAFNGQDFQQQSFLASEGFFGAVGDLQELCDGLDNDCDGEVDEDFFWYADTDGDGYGNPSTLQVLCSPPVGNFTQVAGDCDDTNADINPGTPDPCGTADGLDNDCSGTADDGDLGEWFPDLDNDGFGTTDNIVLACTAPPGHAAGPGDCDDTNAAISPDAQEVCDGIDNNCDGVIDEGFLWYADVDGDGFGDDDTAQPSCSPVPDAVQVGGDCDDTNASLQGGVTLYVLSEFGSFEGSAHYIITQGTTTHEGDMALIDIGEDYLEGSVSVCLGGGCFSIQVTPNDVPLAEQAYVQLFLNPVQSEAFPVAEGFFGSATPAPAEQCDGLDNDCDGEVDEDFFWYTDADGDGFGDFSTPQFSCTPISGAVQQSGDCNDADPNLTTLGAPCNDGDPGTINDFVRPNCTCLGLIQGACPEGEVEDCNGNCAPIEWVGDGFCDDGSFEHNGIPIFFNCPAYFNDGGDCGDPCTTELCDGVDNDCDGEVDEDFIGYTDSDGDGFGDPTTGVVLCAPAPGVVQNGDDCNDNDAAVNPNAFEICDGVDNNCDGVIDESFPDTDGDDLVDCIDACPELADGVPGDACDDGDTGTVLDMLGSSPSCGCMGTPCTTDLELVFTPDGATLITWELREQGTDELVQSGGGVYAASQGFGISTCLPDGDFYLVVTSDLGGIVQNGVQGGYQLITAGGVRIIDNRNNFLSGTTSQIVGGQGFTLPVGTDRLIYVSCDKMDWRSNEYIVANANTAVSDVWDDYGAGSPERATSGYEMWFYNPNGGYSFRRFHSHAVSDGFAPANAQRACHIRVNGWGGANTLPAQSDLLNVKVRGRVIGQNLPWGPACRFKMDANRAECPLTHLMDVPGNQYLSCGGTRAIGSGGANLVHARPVSRYLNGVSTAANRYQFRFRIPDEGFMLVKTSQTGRYWVNTNGLGPCKVYEVDVRASFDNGATWCTDFIAPALTDPWGDVCLLNTACAAQMTRSTTSVRDGSVLAGMEVGLYPNPNRGDQLFVSITGAQPDALTAMLEVRDAIGHLVASRTIALSDGQATAVLDLRDLANGMHAVSVIAGNRWKIERLVIQK